MRQAFLVLRRGEANLPATHPAVRSRSAFYLLFTLVNFSLLLPLFNPPLKPPPFSPTHTGARAADAGGERAGAVLEEGARAPAVEDGPQQPRALRGTRRRPEPRHRRCQGPRIFLDSIFS